jgi:hypothetical protein
VHLVRAARREHVEPLDVAEVDDLGVARRACAASDGVTL